MFRQRPSVTIADATATYLADLAIAGRAEGTIQLYRYLLGRLVKRIGREHNLATLRRDEIIGFLGEVLPDMEYPAGLHQVQPNGRDDPPQRTPRATTPVHRR